MRLKLPWVYTVCAVLACLLLAACSPRDATDDALDALEAAISSAEKSLTQQFGTQMSPDELFAARKKDLEVRGHELQSAYAPVRDLDVAKISRDQEKRRDSLRERAVAVAADLIDSQLHKSTP